MTNAASSVSMGAISTFDKSASVSGIWKTGALRSPIFRASHHVPSTQVLEDALYEVASGRQYIFHVYVTEIIRALMEGRPRPCILTLRDPIF